MGRKRKHEEDGDAQAAPIKKSKSSLRSERRRERLEGKHSTPKDSTAPSPEHIHKETFKRGAKRAERKRRRETGASGALVEINRDEDIAPEDAIDYDSSDAERERRKQRKKARRREERQRNQEQNPGKALKQKQPKSGTRGKWILSDATAGRFITHDPLFVRDASGEDYLIAAVARELQVLSIETSLLVRSVPAPEGTTIVGFATESPESNVVHIADSDGGMSIWDWTNDLPLRSMSPAIGEVKAVAAVRLHDGEEEANVPYVANVDGLNVVKAQDGDLYKVKQNLDSVQVLGKAEYVLALGPNLVIIGKRREDKKYVWIELPLAKPATCMDARMLPPPPNSKNASKRHPQLQLAIGNEEGQIHLYDDVSSLLSPGQQQAVAAPRTLHWHRSAVSSVKFSPDGNYLISGGKETVLVLWQLETGKKQYLPHLTSEVERITVNSRGDRYALQMGDNSIMVLSTAELKPIANFAGLQMQTNGLEVATIPAATLHPKNSKQLFVTVPPNKPTSASEIAPRPFLQTFDLRTARHVTRQALTRNNATDLNVGPEYNAILPPDVVHLAVSRDGEWLVTVDEWMPPASDVLHLASDDDGIEEARCSRREVYLKFWHWDASQDLWTLSTRADAPHQRAGLRRMGAGRVLALVSDPASNGFATVGEDERVKLWRPKTRMRSGVAMRDAQDVELIEWSCRRTVQLSSNTSRADSPLDTLLTTDNSAAVAAYSNDGSLLAVSSSSPNTLDESIPAITFIDTATGAIKSTNTALSNGTPCTALAFLERYLISVTDKSAFVWDLVSDTVAQKIKLPLTPGFEPLLAVNEADQTFAIVTAAEKKGMVARVVVHSTRHTGKVYEREFETRIVKVLSGTENRGFVLLFADATVRTLLPTGAAGRKVDLKTIAGQSSALVPAVAVDAGLDVDKSEDDADGTGLVAASAVKSDVGDVPAFEIDEDDRPVVRPEQLASIFDVGGSFAMPPVKDMFQAVVGLFGRKPQQVSTA